jgi:galactokinase
MLERTGCHLGGSNLLIRGEAPLGSGLSSSAALEVSCGLALAAMSGFLVEPAAMARLCQRAENEFVGMRCGIMDQFIACHGREGSALLLDCRSLVHRFLPLPREVRLVICNTMVKHELASSAYNQRRAECEAAARHFAAKVPGVRALRDVTLEQALAFRGGLEETVFRRARHVISENARVELAGAALEQGDLASFGRLMNESHLSLRDDYEVSCAELDTMVVLARQSAGVLGARMTGGGFGGCTINVVEAACAERFRHEIAAAYAAATGKTPSVFITSPGEGAGEVTG